MRLMRRVSARAAHNTLYLLILLKWIQNDIIKWREALRKGGYTHVVGASPNEMQAMSKKAVFHPTETESRAKCENAVFLLGQGAWARCGATRQQMFYSRREPSLWMFIKK